MIWILDTDHLSLLERRHPQVLEQVASRPPESIAITVITAEEQLRGRLNVVRQASQQQDEKLELAYYRLRQTLDDLKRFVVVDFTMAAIEEYKSLVKQRVRIGTQDLRIASVVRSLDATLVTRNRQDFERVPGLRFEDWTVL